MMTKTTMSMMKWRTTITSSCCQKGRGASKVSRKSANLKHGSQKNKRVDSSNNINEAGYAMDSEKEH